MSILLQSSSTNISKNPVVDWTLQNSHIIMAELASKCLLLLLLSLLSVCSSGTSVGFSYNARGDMDASSLSRIVLFLEQNKVSASHIRVHVADLRILSTFSNSNVSAHLYLNKTMVENLENSKPSALPWLRTQLLASLPHLNIKSISVDSINDSSKLLSALESLHSILNKFHLKNQVKLSVAFPLSFLENLDGLKRNEFDKIVGFVKRTMSSITIEAGLDDNVELGMGDLFLKSIIQKVRLATSLVHCNEVPVVMSIKSLAVPSAKQVAEFASKASKYLQSLQNIGQIAELYAEVASFTEVFADKEHAREHEQIFPSSRRELVNSIRTTLRDAINPPTVFPTPPLLLPPNIPTPNIVTVPATNPVTISPGIPVSTPIGMPYTAPVTAPVTIPSTNPPFNPAVPITSPATTSAPITVPGAPALTNPVTTYPAPAGNIPITNPVAPPATTNAPAIPGQSWCVAKSGVAETALQAALDYACGMGGADCSQIQQGAPCYNPNTMQNHASFAFNSYYQKNPSTSSCDFGGTAYIVSVNPSSGSCIYPSSSSSSSSSSTPSLQPPSTASMNPTPPATTATTTPPTNPASVSPGFDTSGNPPSVLNSSSPTSTYGTSDVPPGGITSASMSSHLQPLISCIILVAALVSSVIILDM